MRGPSSRLDDVDERRWNGNWEPVTSKPEDLSAKKRQKVQECGGGDPDSLDHRVKEWN